MDFQEMQSMHVYIDRFLLNYYIITYVDLALLRDRYTAIL